MNAISLFSGVGGLDLALRDITRTRLYCEVDPQCAAVLRARMASGDLPPAVVHPDIRTLDQETLQAHLALTPIDIVFAGFPW